MTFERKQFAAGRNRRRGGAEMVLLLTIGVLGWAVVATLAVGLAASATRVVDTLDRTPHSHTPHPHHHTEIEE